MGWFRWFALVLSVVVVCAAGTALSAWRAPSRLPISRYAGSTNFHAAPADARELYRDLNALRPDATRVYEVHEINLQRDAISLSLNDGKLAFLQPLDGRITGAVFTGVGHIIATPPDAGERRSLAQFVGVPILDQPFGTLYLRFTDDTAEGIARQIQAAGSTPSNDPQFAGVWAQAVSRLNPSHSLRILEDWLSTNPLPYFFASIGGGPLGPFDAIVDGRRTEQVLIGQSRMSNGGDVYDIWSSFRAGTGGIAETFAPLDYRVDTAIGNDLSLSGQTTLHLKALRAGERVVPLELARSLSVQKITMEGGNTPLVYFQNADLNHRDAIRRGNNAVLVVLPSPVEPGEAFHLQVTYQGSVISDAGNGVEIVGERDAWYAHATGATRFVPYDLTFRWPKRFTLVATGNKVEFHDDGDFKTGRWQSGVPFFVAGFNLGEYAEASASDTLPTIRVYANKQLENAIAARIQANPIEAGILPPIPGIGAARRPPQITEAPPPSPAAVLKQLSGSISDSIHFFEKMNGPFPFRNLSVSQIPGSFGQGWPGLVYLSTYAFLPREAQERAGMTSLQEDETQELMPFHEVAHQWWGNVVGASSYRDAWIEEAMANYLALLYIDSKKPAAHRMTNWLVRFRASLIEKTPGASEDAEDAGPLNLGFRLRSSKDPAAYETVVYNKGTWVIHMLREMLRDPRAADPDARFRQLLQSILTADRFRGLTNADFQHAVEKEMTPQMDLDGTHSMEWFFDQWVRGTGIPRYSVEFKTRPRGKKFLVTGTLLQNNVDDTFTARVPLYSSRMGGRPERMGEVVTIGPETPFRFTTGVRPRRILIDPKLTLLCFVD
ncbi:MAG: M1 family aminopeptidase [Candidatus Acidiferrales bacterium]